MALNRVNAITALAFAAGLLLAPVPHGYSVARRAAAISHTRTIGIRTPLKLASNRSGPARIRRAVLIRDAQMQRTDGIGRSL